MPATLERPSTLEAVTDQRLSVGARLLLMAAHGYLEEGREIPSCRAVGEDVGASTRTVQHWKRELVEAGRWPGFIQEDHWRKRP